MALKRGFRLRGRRWLAALAVLGAFTFSALATYATCAGVQDRPDRPAPANRR